MTIGPLEFVVIGCKGHQFTREIVPELNSIQEKGLIRVVDLFFVRKDANGTVTVLEVNDLNDEELAAFFDEFRKSFFVISTKGIQKRLPGGLEFLPLLALQKSLRHTMMPVPF